MIGSSLAATFSDRQIPFTKLVRRYSASKKNELLWSPASQRPIADTSVLEGFTAAIHLSGANIAGQRWTPSYKHELVESRVLSTKALSDVLAGIRHRPQVLICASATGYYGDRGEEVLTEKSSHGSGFLSELCQDWENATASAQAQGVRVVYLRTGVVLGRNSGLIKKVLPAFRFGLGGKLGSGRQWMSWITIDDLVSAVLFLLSQPSFTGPVNAVAPNPVTNAEFTQTLGKVLHRPAIFPVPAAALRLVFGEMAKETMLASTRVLPGRLLESGFQFQTPLLEDGLRSVLQVN